MEIFTKEYWKTAAKELKSLKRLAFAALVCALTVALDGLARIPLIPGSLEIKCTFIIIALGCAVYGPVAAVLIAIVVDTMSFFLFSTGFAYFPGYMITEIVVSLFYCFFLYRRKITVYRLFFAKVCTNFLAHLLLNSLWSSLLMGKGYLYYFWNSLIKNTLLLPFEVLLLAVFFGAVLPFFSRMGLLPAHSSEELSRLSLRAGGLTVLSLLMIGGSLCCIYLCITSAKLLLFSILGFLLLSGVITLLILNHKKRGCKKSF